MKGWGRWIALASRSALSSRLPWLCRHHDASPALPADEVIGWEFELFGYLLDHLGGYRHFRRRRLMTPTNDDLPMHADGSESYLRRLLVRMEEIAGLLEWPCRVELRDVPPQGSIPEGTHTGISRSFRIDELSGEGVIELDRGGDVSTTIASIAWGLGRFLIDSFGVDLPGGEDMRDAAAEIGGIFLGFGLFAARASAAAGTADLHLCEVLYAVGIFAALQDLQVKGFLRYLDGRSRAILRAVEEDVRGRWQPELDHLREQVPTHRL